MTIEDSLKIMGNCKAGIEKLLENAGSKKEEAELRASLEEVESYIVEIKNWKGLKGKELLSRVLQFVGTINGDPSVPEYLN